MTTTIAPDKTVYLALELSVSTWLVAARLPGTVKPCLQRLDGGDTAALLALIATLRTRGETRAGGAVDVVCCFEAGRDGFWLHRLLTAHGVSAYVLEPTSILVQRRARRAKTDRLDAQALLRVLMSYRQGDREICSMVRVPTPEEEDAKRPHREREHLVQEHLSRIRGVGRNFATVLTHEVFYRKFENRRQLASYVGIAPTPYQSGGMDRDRRIARAGNPRARSTLIQLAWLWLRYQPGSALSTWFRKRVGTLTGRTRRIAIVALARKLLVALWRYTETGHLPDDVAIKA